MPINAALITGPRLARSMPLLGQRRGDKAHRGGVEAIEKDNQETQDHHRH
jgi:hypothetical protein